MTLKIVNSIAKNKVPRKIFHASVLVFVHAPFGFIPVRKLVVKAEIQIAVKN